jgi:hypothetical protein
MAMRSPHTVGGIGGRGPVPGNDSDILAGGRLYMIAMRHCPVLTARVGA